MLPTDARSASARKSDSPSASDASPLSTSRLPASVRHVVMPARRNMSGWTTDGSAFDSASLKPSIRSRAFSSESAAVKRSKLASVRAATTSMSLVALVAP